MGGEWGVGAALALEGMPAKTRGFFSGLLQEGYATGYLLAAIAFFFVLPHLGWRWMFFIGAAPALLVVYIRSQIPESEAWRKRKSSKIGETSNLWSAFLQSPGLFIYAIVLMAAFNFMSHGSQDLYPTFLRVQHHFDFTTTTVLAIIANIGAIVGGMLFGTLSQGWGRKRAIICVRHSVLRAGRVGRHSRSPQRALAGQRPRHLSRLHLPARQPDLGRRRSDGRRVCQEHIPAAGR
jgi:SHS family lactate transporter-like MFS transporter